MNDALTRAHRQYLRDAGLSDKIIDARGYFTVKRPADATPDKIRRWINDEFGIWITEAEQQSGIMIPLYDGLSLDPQRYTYRPDVPGVDHRGKTRKYLQQRGTRSIVDVHPLTRIAGVTLDASVPLWITEGAKKADALASRGEHALMLAGVANWQAGGEPLPEWDTIALQGREVRIAFDADAAKNRNVARQMRDLGAFLTGKGARVRYVIPPAVKGDAKAGVDDYLVAGRTIADLLALARDTPPENARPSADMLAETVVAEDLAAYLADDHVYVPELGWLGWEGTHWAPVPDDVVRGAVAAWVHARLDAALDKAKETGDVDTVRAWHSFNTRSKIDNITVLARPFLLVRAADLDANPDLLNCANGTVDLRTGELLPHDRSDYMTIAAPAAYVKGAESKVWNQVLECIPEDIREWMQVKLGQAVTGHVPDDDRAAILQGSGENGKTLLVNLVSKALGRYYYAAPPKVLLLDVERSLAPEIADLLGRRIVVIEEFPEKNVSSYRLKQLNGGTQITARHLYREAFSFDPSHTLFITTNYLPVITDTDHGTWRRLALIPFPYKFVDNPDPEIPAERQRDFELKAQVSDPDDDLLSAALSWLVEGAITWYDDGRLLPELPDRVQKATDEWRAGSDDIMRFWDECLERDPESVVPARDMFRAYRWWAEQHGQQLPSERSFKPKFEQHHLTAQNRVTVGTVSRDRVNVSTWDTYQVSDKFRGWKGVRLTVSDSYEL